MKIRHFVTAFLFTLVAGGLSVDASAGILQPLSRLTSTLGKPVNVIVRLSPGADLGSVLGLLNGLVLDQIPGTRTYLISLPALPVSLPLGVESMERDLAVALPGAGQPVTISRLSGMSPLWYADQPALTRIELPEAHHFASGEGIIVADIDSRFDAKHPALSSRLVDGHDFVADSNAATDGGLDQSSSSYMFQSSASYMFQSSASYMFQSSASYMFGRSGTRFVKRTGSQQDNAGTTHGTFTAGVIAAVAPEASIMPIRAFDDTGNADLFTLAKSIRYAVNNGANVINMSWGTADDSQTLHAAIKFALAHHVILIAAAGNSDTDSPYYPAAYAGVTAVAATDNSDRKAAFSSYGKFVAVSAPGVNIISAWPGGQYGVKSGTSFSAPIVAGEAALVESIGCGQVRARIMHTARSIDWENPGYAGELGQGSVDLLQGVWGGACNEGENR